MATLRNDAMDDSVTAALFLGSICTSVPVRVCSIELLYIYINIFNLRINFVELFFLYINIYPLTIGGEYRT